MQGSRPGSRPGAWWRFEAPEGAPDREDYRGSYSGLTNRIEPDPDGDLTTEEYELDRLRFLASHGLLGDDEIAEVLAEAERQDGTRYLRESAERKADAVLDGLAERDSAEGADRLRPTPRRPKEVDDR